MIVAGTITNLEKRLNFLSFKGRLRVGCFHPGEGKAPWSILYLKGLQKSCSFLELDYTTFLHGCIVIEQGGLP